ncbi:MAG: Asp-tRNA(Asn)/Glu-tRNA(Gln) amidotransferase subunit GatA [Calditrichae bacterium]|nr:Asp-tRNA(Asn)/Glu-tRNA(Gln) amidotransferase subunit GatA [Calditrichia bacterium]NIW78221.1 Asp-tRNA(Asn)/Glu-tRNA(Gln) amidotransferase subunit GatA [Calditrichia bacterium]
MYSAVQKHNRYIRGEFNLVNEVEPYLQKIERFSDVNAFIDVYWEKARLRAKEIDQKRDRGDSLGKLAGLMVAVKDNICLEGERVTCASRILENFISPYDATVISKLLAEDALIIGKTNLDEFGMGSSTESSIFGASQNPFDKQRVAGGSSGGSAIAVAKEMADLALGSDTGGSIRQPAAFCGIVGLKPTYGRVSRYGLVAYASSLDQIGPFGKSVPDTALLLNCIAGVDSHDSTSIDKPVPDYLANLKKEGGPLTIGVPKQNFQNGLDAEIGDNINRVIELLKEREVTIKEVDLFLSEYAIATYYIIATAEASSNLARFDGVRYGYRAQEVEDLQEMYRKTRSEGFGTEVKRRIMLGTYTLSSGYYDAYYKKAQQVRRLIKEQYDKVFKGVDVLVTPTTPTPPFKLGEKLDDPLQMYLSDIYTVTVNLAGICALNLPIGQTNSGLPIGAQFICGAFQEELLLKAAFNVEQILIKIKD